MLVQFKDYLKTLKVAEHYSIGKINAAQQKSLGVYGDNPLAQVESIGRCSSYGISAMRILLHWTKDLAETEAAARDLYDKLKGITDTDMTDVHVQYIYLPQDEPTFVGTDDTGVYEYVISVEIYYRR